MVVEKAHTEGDTPKEVYETIDGTPLQAPLCEVFPQLNRVGGRVSLEDLMNSGTAAGEALRRTFAKIKAGASGKEATTAVAATYRPTGK